MAQWIKTQFVCIPLKASWYSIPPKLLQNIQYARFQITPSNKSQIVPSQQVIFGAFIVFWLDSGLNIPTCNGSDWTLWGRGWSSFCVPRCPLARCHWCYSSEFYPALQKFKFWLLFQYRLLLRPLSENHLLFMFCLSATVKLILKTALF